MDALGDRIVAWTLRAAATALIFAGIALFVAGIPAWSMVSGSAHDVLRGVVDRYQTAVTPTATALAWAWLGYAIWIPPVVLSGRRR